MNDADNVYYLDDDLDSAMNTVDETKIPSDEEYGKMLTEDKDDVEDEMFDKYLNAELMIDRGGETVRGTVVKRAKNDAGDPIGRRHANPKMDTREYEVEFIDGTTERYSANIVAENLYSQCDSEGNQYLVLKEIVDHKSDESALRVGDGYTVGRNGNLHPKITTRGWKLLCEWKDGSTEWIALKEIKDSYPLEIAEYAVANRIQEEPAFKWWVGDVLRARNRIIGKVKSRYWRTTHKFGIRVPKSVPEALQIDEDTGTTYWWDAIKKEMDKVMVAFDVEEELTADDVRQGVARGDFVGYQEIACHWVFDVKMDLTRKRGWWLAGT